MMWGKDKVCFAPWSIFVKMLEEILTNSFHKDSCLYDGVNVFIV